MSKILKSTKEIAKLGGYTEGHDIYPAACGVMKATIEGFFFWMDNCKDYESLKQHIERSFQRITDDV